MPRYVVRAKDCPAFLPDKHVDCKTRRLLSRDTVGSEHAAVLRSEFAPGGHALPHDHPFEQYYYILKGTAEVAVENEKYPVEEGDTVFFPAGSIHSIRNTGKGEMWLVAVNAPQS